MLFLMRTYVVLGLAWAGLCWGQERPEVTLPQGTVRGLQATQYNFTYLQFLSIPFAEPPVGPLRFKNPEPAGPWEGVLDASHLPLPCDQYNVVGSEDCLYLNIYTPVEALNTSQPLAVMVFIHGGGWTAGSSREFDGPEELLAQDVIVVVLQYRLGTLGFLSTEDAAAPGNQGLKDQTLALKWVKDNIASFGGDPDRITIFGQSAGAASVHWLMLAPSAAGLFGAAIAQSGNAISPWSTGRNFLASAQTLAESFGCPREPSEALVNCLQTVDEHELQKAHRIFVVWNTLPYTFGPYVGGDGFLPEEPVTLLQEGRYYHVPAIIGMNKDEMAMQTVEMFATPRVIDNLMENFTECGPASLQLFEDEDPVTTSYTVYDHYNGGINITKERCDDLTHMYTDGIFLTRHDYTLQLMSGQSPVYAYELHHRGQHSNIDVYLNAGLDLPQAENYISHGDELQYLFNPEHDDLTTAEDLTVSDIFLTTWTNFAKHRNPTPDGSLGFVWEQSNPGDLQHLNILPQPFMEADQRAEVRAFWQSLPLRINRLLNP